MDNKRKVKLKSCKKESRRDRGPLLRPDVMLITKDVMVPIKLPPPTGRRFSTQNYLKNKFRTEKVERLDTRELKRSLKICSGDPDDSYTKESLSQVKEIKPEENIAEEIIPKSSFCSTFRANESQNNSHHYKKETVSLENQYSSLKSSPGLFELNIKESQSIESVKKSETDKPLALSSRNSVSSLTTSAETRSCSSGKSLDMTEDSLPKLPSNIISSSESERNICAPDIAVIPLKCYSENDRQGNDVDTNALEDSQIMIDVEYLLQNLLTDLETLEDFNSSGNSNGNVNVEKQYRETINQSEYNNLNEQIPKMVELGYSLHDLGETVLASDDFNSSCNESGRSYSWQELNLFTPMVTSVELDDEKLETVYNNNSDISSNQSDEQMEMKYSWQIITQKNQGVSNTDQKDGMNNEKNSKLTSTEDLSVNKPEVQYSWQKLTSKYLAGKPAGDCDLSDTNQPVLNIINNVSKEITNAECVKEYPSLRETCMYNSSLNTNIEKEIKSKEVKDIGRATANSPLNNIISSMLPEIKSFNRRSSCFNNTTPKFVGNYRDNPNRNKSSASYSSVSSIKHVIANLNEMLTTQKHTLDNYVKNHKLDQSFSITEPSVNPANNTVEKVEIFPSTLHVLGNYIVRDIRPTDMNDQKINSEDSNNDKTIQDHLLSNDSVNLQNIRLDKPAENVLNKKIPATDKTRSNDSWSRLPIDIKEADFSSFLSNPIPYDCDYYSTICAADDNLAPKMKNRSKDKPGTSISQEIRNSLLLSVPGYKSRLTEINWKRAIAEMEGTIGLSQEATRLIDQLKDDGIEPVPYTKSPGLLIPRVQVSLSETKEAAGDSKNRRDELCTRLEGAMSRLKQSEQHLDANWNLDYSVLDIEESISDKEVQLPKQVEEHIKDIIKSAEEYLAKLEEQLNDLSNADDQIINTSERTFRDIDETYQLFMDNLCQEINKRRNLVRLETEVFKYEGLAPLRACKQEVDAQIRSTQHLIVLTENMLSHPITFNKERLGKIITATSHMGRIPAVPMPEELPYVTFSPPSEEIKKEIVDRISCLGCVMRMGPAQLTEVWERPAGLQLKWHVVDPEYASEEQIFIVEKALGEITEPTSSAFETVYVGSETSCFVRDLPVDHLVTLRVGIQVTDTAWSVHRIAQTSIPAYSWDMENSDYLITNGGKIATKVTQNLSTLLSRSPQFSANYIIEFKFLEAATGTDNEGIGLVFEPGGVNDTLRRNGAILITPNGNIFMNGEQKLMQLPKIVLGTRIIFTSEPKDDDTLRMTIECANKAVTYDWTVQRPLHFAARFSEHNKWNLMVK